MKRFSLFVLLFGFLSASAAELEQAKVFAPNKTTTLPPCKNLLSAKLKSCEALHCYNDGTMGLKFENIVHGFSSDKKYCLFSTPNQQFQLTEAERLRLSKYLNSIDQSKVENETIGLGSISRTYKFSDFSCDVNVTDKTDTTGANIIYTEFSLTQKSSPKCKNIDFNIMKDLYLAGRVKNIQPKMER